MNLTCKEFALHMRLTAIPLTCFKHTFGGSSTEHNICSVNQCAHVRHQFPKIKSDIYTVEQQKFDSSFTIITDAVSVDEESLLVAEIEKLLKRLRYQSDHWDDVIILFISNLNNRVK